ncbi:MAG: MFS transporter [Oscillospiraceae bacterium]|nr:MFS transporter [Oscillospiraceae bacterium]
MLQSLQMKARNVLRGFREYLFFRGLKLADLIMGLSAAALVLFCWLFPMNFSEVFTSTIDITLGYSAKQDEQGLYYVVDNGHSRLFCFDEEGAIRYAIVNPQDDVGNLYIDDFAVENGLVYLSATEWDGMLLSREVIAVFKGERLIRTVAERDYGGMDVNKRRFHGITVRDGVLSYVECEENALIPHWLTLADGEERTQRIYFDNAFNAVGDCAFYGDGFYVLEKQGRVTAFEGGRRALAYSTRWKGEESRVPYRMTIDPDGAICFIDIRSRKAMKVDGALARSVPICEETFSQTLHFTRDGTGAMYLEEDGLRVVTDTGTKTYLTLQKPLWRIALQIVWFAAMAALTLLLVTLSLRGAIVFVTRKYSTAQLISFWVIGTVATVSLLLCGMLIGNFSEIYRNRITSQMENSARIVANQIPYGVIAQIQRAEDFDSEAYETLCDVMEQVFPMDLDLNRRLYCNILRLSEDGQSGFAVAYLDQSIGCYFPLDESELEEVREAYRANGIKSVWNNELADISGTYLSVKVPIYENEEVSGVVAVGTETYVIQDMITRLQIQIFLSVIVILMLIWLIISEVMAWLANRTVYLRAVGEGDPNALPGHMIRLLVFAVFACYNMTATFLPVWILRNSELFPDATRDFMASVPLTVNIFVIGVMSLFTSGAVRRLGLGRVMTFSALSSLCGNLLMFLFPSYYAIFAGLLLDGIGVGLITNATYVLLTYIKDEVNQQWGFTLYNAAYLSGINFGMLLGSMLAVGIGQRPVFLIVALVWLCLSLVGNLMLRQLAGLLNADATEEAREAGISFGRFLFNRPVMSFIVLIQNPYIVFNSFVFYFVPLFCGNMGYDETTVSILIMLYSEVAVLTGDMLTHRVTKLLGNKGMYAAFLTNIIAVMTYALMPNMLGVVLALLMLGVAAAYGKTLQQTWFLQQKAVRKYGEDRAMGVYNFTENIGESLGPIVFARLMSLRPLLGAVSAFCGGIAALGAGHFVLNRKEMKKE